MDPDSSSPLGGLSALWPLAGGAAPVLLEAGLLALLLALAALLSGSGAALFALTEEEREALGDDAAGRRVRALLERPRRLRTVLLLLSYLSNAASAILAASLAVRAAALLGWGTGALLAVAVAVMALLLFGLHEVAPTLAARSGAARLARAASLPLAALVRLLGPLAEAAGSALRRRRGGPEGEPEEADAGHGSLQPLAELEETTVREVMVSRVDVHAIPETATLVEALEVVGATGFSRFPLFREHLDHILGVVYAKDLIPFLNGGGAPRQRWGPTDWAALARPALFVPLSRRLDDMLEEFRRSGTHIAVVVDEYGGTAGIVTLEDVLEEIVGDIRDEHDLPEALPYQAVGPNTYRVEAGVDLDDLSEALELGLETEAFDFETLGGLVIHLLGRIPDVGEVAEHGHLRLRVERVENNRIKRVLLEVLPEPAGVAEEEGGEA